MPKLHIAEAVGSGHPDRIADRISNIVHDVLNPTVHKQPTAIETLVTSGLVLIAGEVGPGVVVDVEAIKARISEFLDSIGYSGASFEILVKLKTQSQDIVTASRDEEVGLKSGDQCVAVGYATNSTPNRMPLAWNVARAIIAKVEDLRERDVIPGLRRDAKCLVSLFDKELNYLVLSVHHDEQHNAAPEELRRGLYAKAVTPVLLDMGVKFNSPWIHINRTPFNIGGLDADTGATNRKTTVDAYGTAAPHGGGGLNGKDMDKIDRLLAYYMRWICVNIVGAGLCSELELQAHIRPGAWKPSFSLGRVTGIIDSLQWSQLAKVIRRVFDHKLGEIHEIFGVWNEKLEELGELGHFGRPELPWETLDRVDQIKEAVNGVKYLDSARA